MSFVSDVVAAISSLFKSEVSKEWSALTKEIKEAKQEWKTEALEQKKTIYGLRLKIEGLQNELHTQRLREEKCLRQQTRIIEAYRVLRERLIFLTKGKPDNFDETLPDLKDIL